MEWITLDAATVTAHLPTDLAGLYATWLAENPDKANRLAEITANTVAELRDNIRSNPANTLDPDPAKIPQSAIRHAESIIFFQLSMEMGLDIDTEGTQSMTRADMFLRQISYNHFATTGGESAEGPTPLYTVPDRLELPRRALPVLLLVMAVTLAPCQRLEAGWIANQRTVQDTSVNVTFAPQRYTNANTQLYGHLQGIDAFLAGLIPFITNQSGSGAYLSLSGGNLNGDLGLQGHSLQSVYAISFADALIPSGPLTPELRQYQSNLTFRGLTLLHSGNLPTAPYFQSFTNITPTNNTLRGLLAGVDAALGQIKTNLSSNLLGQTNGISVGVIQTLNAGPGIQGLLDTNGIFTLSTAIPISTNNVGTNRVSFTFTGSTNYWSVPAGVSQLMVWAWSGAVTPGGSAGGAGGYSWALVPVTPLEELYFLVGQGGIAWTCDVAGCQTPNAWPNGGRGAARSTIAFSGAGRSEMGRGTNVILIAGAPSGSSSLNFGVSRSGGGATGVDGVGSGAGYVGGKAGTETNGGALVTGSIPLSITNSGGGLRFAGDAGIATNVQSINAGGGGDGYYGGSGGIAGSAASGSGGYATGGSGSGYINRALVSAGQTYRQVSGTSTPVGADMQEWLNLATPGYGTPSVGHGGRASHGAIVVGY